MPCLSDIPQEGQHLIAEYHNLVSASRVAELEAGCSESLVRECICCRAPTTGEEENTNSEEDCINVEEGDSSEWEDPNSEAESFNSEPEGSSSELEGSPSDVDGNVEKQKKNSSLTLNIPVTQQMPDTYKEFQHLLHRIRTLPGFETFQKPAGLAEQELAAVNHPGPVVFINNTRFGIHAIILRGTATETLRLKTSSFEEVEDWYDFLNHAQNTRTMAASNLDELDDDYMIENDCGNEQFREMQQWLWKSIVRPVLNHLGFIPKGKQPTDSSSSGLLPRIWWIGIGKLANFPFHAAGEYNKRKSKNRAMRYCISSYATTLQSLLHSLKQDLPATATRIAFVNAPDVTPSVQLAENVEGISIQTISGSDLVCKAISEVDIVHFTSQVTKVTDSYGASSFNLREILEASNDKRK